MKINTNFVTIKIIKTMSMAILLCFITIAHLSAMHEEYIPLCATSSCSYYCDTVEQALALLLSDNQEVEYIRIQAYKTLTAHERLNLMPKNYFDQTSQNRMLVAKLARTIITLAHKRALYELDDQEYATLEAIYTKQYVALREAQLSLKLGVVNTLFSKLSAAEKQILKNKDLAYKQDAYTLLKSIAELVYTEVIIPKTADNESCKTHEFHALDKQAYIAAFVALKTKELEKAD